MAVIRRLPIILASTLLASSSFAAGIVIGVVAPDKGNFESLGRQILNGATVQATAAGDTIVPISESCEPDSGIAVAGQLVAAKVSVAIGFLCSETLESALPALKEAQIPAITLSVRSGILMEDALKAGQPFFRMAPTDGAEAARIIEVMLSDWQGQPFALIEDGTIHGRELAETIRNALEEKGLKPVFTDTYRPGQEQQVSLVRRLAKTGANHVFIGGDRNDAAIIARDAASENIALTLMGGDALNAANQPVPLADGVSAVTLPDGTALAASAEIIQTMAAQGIQAEGYVLRAHAAAALASAAATEAKAEEKPVADSLLKRAFETVIGPVRFTENHELSENPYRLLQWHNGAFVPPPPETN